jgi:hypothetical protein
MQRHVAVVVAGGGHALRKRAPSGHVARALRANFGWQRDAALISLSPIRPDTFYKRSRTAIPTHQKIQNKVKI